MENHGTRQQEYSVLNPNPWLRLIYIILYAFAGMFIGQFLGVLLAMLFFGLGYQDVVAVFENFRNEPNGKYILYCIQFGSALGAFIIAPILYLKRFEAGYGFAELTNKKARNIIPLVLTVFLTLAFMMVNSIVIEWNSDIVFPESLKWLEEIFQEEEARRQQLTEYLVTFNSLGDFLLAFLIVAILPGIGEELLFRGLIQRNLGKAIQNPHIAIWGAAFIFGVIHFQFFGLLPRMFLGLIFGYLYYWSGSLLLPALGHFINNGFGILMVYLYQINMVEMDYTETTSLPYSYILVLLLLGGAGLWYIRSFFNTPRPQTYE